MGTDQLLNDAAEPSLSQSVEVEVLLFTTKSPTLAVLLAARVTTLALAGTVAVVAALGALSVTLPMLLAPAGSPPVAKTTGRLSAAGFCPTVGAELPNQLAIETPSPSPLVARSEHARLPDV
jgi:hypothetical protein